MTEIAVKALQKEMLDNFEKELLDLMSPENFNSLRKLVFRSTFLCYRLGFLGPHQDEKSYEKLLGLGKSALFEIETTPIAELDEPLQKEVLEYCLFTWLQAYRLGALSRAET